MRVGIIAALPGELKPLVHDWEAIACADGTRKWIHRAEGDVWIAVCSGMGGVAVRRAFEEAEADGALDMVVSVGWAGELMGLRPGRAWVISTIFDAETGEMFRASAGMRVLRLVTTPHVADKAEKKRLGEKFKGAVMVDMEAAHVARMARLRGIPMGCFKAVSDDVSANLPDINGFISPLGRLRMLPFLLYLAVRPWFWWPVAQLGRNSAKAAEAICKLILEFMKEKNFDRLERTENA